MEEPFSSGYFATLLIADHIQKASRGAKRKKCFIRPIQPDASVDGHGAESCHEAVEQTGQCVAFPEHFQHRITHGLISLHGQRIDTLHRILDRHLFPGGQSQQISVQNDITADEPPADPRQNYSGDQTAVFQHILPVVKIAAVFLLLQKGQQKE